MQIAKYDNDVGVSLCKCLVIFSIYVINNSTNFNYCDLLFFSVINYMYFYFHSKKSAIPWSNELKQLISVMHNIIYIGVFACFLI